MGAFGYIHALVPLISLAVNVLSQVIIARYIPGWGLLNSLFSGFVSGAVFLCALECYLFSALPKSAGDSISVFIGNFIAYSSLGYCYFHFVNLGETARRIRIIRELYASRSGLSMREITGRYGAGEIIARRMSRLLKNGQIVLKDGAYRIGRKDMLIVSRIIFAMKMILSGKALI